MNASIVVHIIYLVIVIVVQIMNLVTVQHQYIHVHHPQQQYGVIETLTAWMILLELDLYLHRCILNLSIQIVVGYLHPQIRLQLANGTTLSRDVRAKENTKKLYRHANANAITTIPESRASQ
ncbi:hypothetical protein A2U01_0038264, partial [Trifolium medium]|nr:hypothetical protein [Trifolium medium]